jgi:hypothetical protein
VAWYEDPSHEAWPWHCMIRIRRADPGQSASRQTLLVKSSWSISNAIRVRVTRRRGSHALNARLAGYGRYVLFWERHGRAGLCCLKLSHRLLSDQESSMTEPASLADVTFTENGPVDAAQLNALYRLIGWDRQHRR